MRWGIEDWGDSGDQQAGKFSLERSDFFIGAGNIRYVFQGMGGVEKCWDSHQMEGVQAGMQANCKGIVGGWHREGWIVVSWGHGM